MQKVIQNAHKDSSAPVGRLAISVECFPVHNGPVIANRRKISKGGVIVLQTQSLSANYPSSIFGRSAQHHTALTEP